MTDQYADPKRRQQKQSRAQEKRQISREDQPVEQSEQAVYDELDQPVTDPDEDQYGNLDEPDLDLYGDLDKREMVQYPDQDAELQDQFGSQNPIGSQSESDTPGGEGLYDVQDQYGNDKNVVQPGSSRDQYGTRGSQDQYGDQQNIK